MRRVSAFFVPPVNKSESRLSRFLFPKVTSKSKFDINKLSGIIPDAIWVVLKLIQPALGYPPTQTSLKSAEKWSKEPQKMAFLVFLAQNVIQKSQISMFSSQWRLQGHFAAFRESIALYTAEWGVYPLFLLHRSTSQNRDCRDFYFQMWLQNQSLI